MEEIKVRKELFKKAIFMYGNDELGTYIPGGSQIVENEDPKNLFIDPKVVNFYFAGQYLLTDDAGKTYVSNSDTYDYKSPTIYCGRAVSTVDALSIFRSGTWQHEVIKNHQANGGERVSISNDSLFVEGMDKNGFTLEEYMADYTESQSKTI